MLLDSTLKGEMVDVD